MAHILFEGDIQQQPALRSLLWQWGVTVGRLPRSGRRGVLATVEECDAVLFLNGNPGPDGHGFSAMPDGAETEGAAAAAAPLLFVGPGPEAGLTGPHEPVVIPDLGPKGCRLKMALRTCLEKARRLRGDSASGRDRDRFRDFVGHELRSPLTAVKTALSTLSTLAGATDPGQGAGRMIHIALRNLDRLAETVEWSQELNSLAVSGPAADLGTVAAASVMGVIPEHLVADPPAEGRGAGCEGALVLTDLELLGTLARQMERVFSYAAPGTVPACRLDHDPEGALCRLAMSVTGNAAASAPNPVSRSGGGPGIPRDRISLNREEFENYARMLISPHLLEVLGVRLRVTAGSGGTLELSVGLPLASSASVPDPLCQV